MQDNIKQMNTETSKNTLNATDVVLNTVPARPEQQQKKNTEVAMVQLKDIAGKVVPLNALSINNMSSDAGKTMSVLADQIMGRVTVADNDQIDNGITQVLALTTQTDPASLKNRTGVWGRVTSYFQTQKAQAMAHVTTVSQQVADITKNLKVSVDRMIQDSKWIDNVAKEHATYINNLMAMNDNVTEVLEQQIAILEAMQEDPNVNIMEVQEQTALVTVLEKQVDKLLRLETFAKNTAPQIIAIKMVNLDAIDKFNSLETDILPAWKTAMSLSIISQRQQKDLELSDAMQTAFEAGAENQATLVAKNLVAAAEASGRAIISDKSLIHIKETTLQGVNDAGRIHRQNRETRRIAAAEIRDGLNRLDNELRNLTFEQS